ncbi:hypothetical protein CO038_04790 [Candidatus Pacearchaeota archaeon CG_4_9_14_0_2_um_filter_39_13]|nr:hypothetical protein [Candidatus Pacearchaeota archaeon]OIO44435.1 MAG: hypothetical protein AUJ64_00135 [Candidatus Pacearchaeota archaeon CG1_02_39_14]PJC44235.1 MAG: hypothetical protein CO038_04790 [Candidatus Pacearchaeota archaeon CG_4_9_14_0_2_um_filter_39_13]
MRNQKTLLVLPILVISFFLNLLWEISHSLLYDWSKAPLRDGVNFFVPRILISTIGDVFYIFIILLIISLFRRGFNWTIYPKKTDYTYLVILGLFIAILIEIKAGLLNLWSYNQYMPLIFGIGLTPLIQLAITSSLAVLIASRFICKNKVKGRKR